MLRVLFLFLLMFSIQAHSMTAEQASDLALANSHDIKILKLQLESTRWDSRKSYSAFLPKVDIDGRHLVDNKFEELEVPFGGSIFVMPAIYPYTSLGITATWNIFNGFHDVNGLQAARAGNFAAQNNFQRAVDQKKVEIRSLFAHALASQTLVDVLNKNIEALEDHLHDINIRIHSGVSTRYDRLRAEVQLEESQTEKVAAENDVTDSRSRLFEALGIADNGEPLSGNLSTEFLKLDLATLENHLNTRADRQALIAQSEQMYHLSKASKSHWLPAVSLLGNYEWYNNINKSVTESDERFKSAYSVGVELTWNLFDGGAKLADQKKAAIESQIAREKLAKFDQTAPSDLKEIKNRFNYDLVNFKAKQSSVDKAAEAVRLARGELRAGTRTNSEILDAIVALNRARAAAIKAQLEAIEDMGRLELSYGTSL